MPLRDHFRSPLDDQRHWEGFLATWPVMIVGGLQRMLPRYHFAEPRVVTEVAGESSYEVRVHDEKRHCRLVAAVEIVSPANKDRPEHRRAFVAKCAGLLRERVSVVIVDVMTTRTANLYAELLDHLGLADTSLATAPALYSAACRLTKPGDDWRLEAWSQPLSLGQTLPTMPLWLADDLAVPLDLADSYEQSCGILNLP